MHTRCMRQPTRNKATRRSRRSQWITPCPPFEALAQPSRPQHLPRKRQTLGWHTCLLLRPSTCADDVTRMATIPNPPVVQVPLDAISVGVEDAGRRGFRGCVVLQTDAATNTDRWQPFRERRKLRRGSLALRRGYITEGLGGVAHLGWIW
eukprot:scaffold20179_cov72-Phaeocystis_antarctica.AAC.4